VSSTILLDLLVLMDILNKGNEEGERQKVAIVTGSSSGIGYITSLMFVRKGFYTYTSNVISINLQVSKR
jgi:hypothetical protein